MPYISPATMSIEKIEPQSGGSAGEKLRYRKESDHSDISHTEVENTRITQDSAFDEGQRKRLEASAKLEHPLAGFSPDELAQRGEDFCKQHGITDEEDVRAFRLGAMIAGNMNNLYVFSVPAPIYIRTSSGNS